MNSSDRVVLAAPAKINLCLHVGGRRADGYHDLESLVAFSSLGDEIELLPAEEFSLQIEGPFGAALTADAQNLALRAACLLADRTRTTARAHILLKKRIPVAAGLGGGSADAAAVLRGLAQMWNLSLSRDELRGIAASLGADVPVCIDSTPAWMEGRGERVMPLAALPEVWLLLVNPRVAVSTAEVFAALGERRGLGIEAPTIPFASAAALARFLHSTTNDLEAPARAVAPVIGEVLDEIAGLPGVLASRMSGSGATCFGLFESAGAARLAVNRLAGCRRGWWLEATSLAPEILSRPKVESRE